MSRVWVKRMDLVNEKDMTRRLNKGEDWIPVLPLAGKPGKNRLTAEEIFHQVNLGFLTLSEMLDGVMRTVAEQSRKIEGMKRRMKKKG